MRIVFEKGGASYENTRGMFGKIWIGLFYWKKIEEGELFKIEKGIYSEKQSVPEIAMLVYKYPKAVVTMKSAFSFYGLTAM